GKNDNDPLAVAQAIQPVDPRHHAQPLLRDAQTFRERLTIVGPDKGPDLGRVAVWPVLPWLEENRLRQQLGTRTCPFCKRRSKRRIRGVLSPREPACNILVKKFCPWRIANLLNAGALADP